MHTSSTSPKGITTYNMEKERKIRRATQVNLKKHDYQCGHMDFALSEEIQQDQTGTGINWPVI